MNNYTYKIHLKAETPQKAEEIVKAMTEIAKALKHEDLLWLAKVASTKPELIEVAKKFA